MVLHKLVRRNYGRKLQLSIKHQNLHSFKEGMIPLCQSILERKRISHLHGSAFFTIHLIELVSFSNSLFYAVLIHLLLDFMTELKMSNWRW